MTPSDTEQSFAETTPVATASSLYYREGGSDKVYHVQLEEKDEGWVVNFQYGRRLQSLQSGTKTQKPVAYAKARSIYEKLIREKMSKGYSPGEEGAPFQGTDSAGEVSGIVPQLSNFITEERVLGLLEDDDWLMQEKHDGVRLLARTTKDKVDFINRKGLIVSGSTRIESELKKLISPVSLTLDGEGIGDDYHTFDLLESGGSSWRDRPLIDRIAGLEELFQARGKGLDYISVVDSFLTTRTKKTAYAALKVARAEGVIFKKKDSLYVPGRPNSGGNSLKFKFYAAATVLVAARNDKRSVQMHAGADNGTSYIGNVTVPANQAIPEPGQLIEVRYLYAYKNGCLFQATIQRVRTDVTEPDHLDTLKYKVGPEDDEV